MTGQRVFMTLDFTPLLSAISCPVLVLYGDRDAAAVAGAKTYRNQLSNVEIRALSDVGHDVFFEAPTESLAPQPLPRHASWRWRHRVGVDHTSRDSPAATAGPGR